MTRSKVKHNGISGKMLEHKNKKKEKNIVEIKCDDQIN
jgi:hypothetical protein